MRILTNSQTGLSLIEAIIFILIISIGLSATISVYLFTTRNSANAMLSLKTVELSQAIMDEILSKGFDDNTPSGGGCVEGYASTNCSSGTTAEALLATDFGSNPGETRRRFDDVDDYHNIAYCGEGVAAPDSTCAGGCPVAPADRFIDQNEANIESDYRGYSVCIQISFAGNEMNNVAGGINIINVLDNDAKRIDIIIRDPLDARLTFTAYRTNF